MRIWHDACTGKHVRYGTAIVRRERKDGHDTIFTARRHPDTLALARELGEQPIVVGKYTPRSLHARLQESARRTSRFLELFRDRAPDIAISNQSVEQCRVAFGLKIPLILTADTPHADAVNRLTIPLADYLIVSAANPQRVFRRYGAKKIVQFEGVDEVAWIRNCEPSKKFDFDKPLIVVRQMETKAVYASSKTDVTKKLAQKLKGLGNVLFLPRYSTRKSKGLLVMKDFVDSAELVSHADLVLSMGGTLAREAALQGIPTIVVSAFGRIYVNEYLRRKGFPLFIVRASDVLPTARKYFGKKWDVKKKLAELANPLDIIAKIVDSERLT